MSENRNDPAGDADLASLDRAFELPEGVCSDPRLRELYEVIVARMRREASHLPMNTVQQLLIERIATNYIVLKSKESHRIGTDDGFAHATVQKDFNTFWLTMTKEFNSMLVKSASTDRERILNEVRDVIMGVLRTVPDEDSRRILINRFALAFEREGL